MTDMTDYAHGDTSDVNAPRYALPAAMLWTVAIRAIIVVLGIVSTVLAHQQPTASASGTPWLAWDGKHYVDILKYGYAASRSMTDASVRPLFWDIAFFPLLPFLAKPLTLFCSPEVSLVIVGNICSLLGFAFFYLWLRNLVNARFAFIGTIVLACWPGSVFFSAGLTEGPFLLVVAATLYFLQKNRFWTAAIVASVGTLTRPTGVALSCTVALYALIHLPTPQLPKRFVISCLIGLVAVSGAVAYEAFLWHRYGKYDAYLEAQSYWEVGDNTRLAAEKSAEKSGEISKRYSAKWFIEKANTPQAWNRAIAVGLFIVIALGFSMRSPVPRELFVLPLIIFIMTALPNHGLRASSIIRYESGAIPLFALMTLWMISPSRWRALTVFLMCSGGLQLLYAWYFSRGIWIG